MKHNIAFEIDDEHTNGQGSVCIHVCRVFIAEKWTQTCICDVLGDFEMMFTFAAEPRGVSDTAL